ncbi:MAG: DUF885 domain-containing protein [Verrucomicrobia bacterium]|nr:DUF885 domain-containing protein [Verrucomicrobiota bacterium]
MSLRNSFLPRFVRTASTALAAGLLLTVSIGSVRSVVAEPAAAESAFQEQADAFLQSYFAARPMLGVSLGLHEYDGKLTDFRRAALEAEDHRLRAADTQFAAIPSEELSPSAALDLRVLRLAIARELFSFEDAHDFDKNPMTYAGALDVNVYLKRNFAPLADRLRSIVAIEKQAPALFAAARENLVDPLPKPKVALAILIARGAADFLTKDLVAAVKPVQDEALLKEFRAVNAQAISLLQDYANWLEKERLPNADDSFALGPERYRKFLEVSEAVALPAEKILEIGLTELKKEQERFVAAAKIIDPTKPAIEVFKDIQREHPTAASLIPDTKKDLEAIRRFLVDHKTISLPSEVRALVEETPSYLRATTFASMDTPGPFEKHGAEAYYYVTPVETNWTPKEKEEWLTAFNRYTSDVVSIHEAYPGHYVQFLHLNASSVSRIQKIFGSYAYIEGWAHYCEQMLIREGYGQGGDAVTAAKYRLAQSDEALLRLCRLCVSIKMHTQGMSVDDAAIFFHDNCYYEPKPAMQEALRGTFDPGYLFYTLGKLEILKLREDYRKQEGEAFSMQKFHDAMTDHGQMPVRLLREVLLKDKTAWEDIL